MNITTLDKVKNITLVTFLGVLWVTFLNSLMLPFLFSNETVNYLFFGCIMAPVCEELLFRHVSFQLVKLLPTSSEAVKVKLIMLTVILTSIIFGLIHGRGSVSILIQGFLGFGFAFVYLKNNYSYWSAVVTHAMWNLICLFYSFGG